MANISDAAGRFYFEPDFVKKHGDLLQDWIDRHSQSYYGFALEENKIESDGSIGFYASGRWAYRCTLESEGIGWTNKDETTLSPDDLAENRAIKALGQALADEKSVVRVEYTDYESGCCVFYRATTLLYYTSATEFTTEEVEYEDLDLNLPDLVENGFECAAYDLSEPDDQETFRKEIEKHYFNQLEKENLDPGTFCTAVISEAQKSNYRKGIILEWEAEDFERLLDISEIGFRRCAVEWDIDIDEAYEKLDKMTTEAAAKALDVPERAYANMTTEERHEYAYDAWHHNRVAISDFMGLPEEVDYPDYIKTDDLADYLSDRFGFLVSSVTTHQEKAA